jgi:arylsulfatase A-like enzyme
MELDEVTIPEVLEDYGYKCCHVGKWHLGPDAWYPDRQGFDYNIGGCDYGQPPSYFDPYYRNEDRPNIPTLEPRKQGEYLTDREADEAVKFIKDHADQPFFLYMAHYAVHTPIQGRADLVEKYEAKPPTHQDNATYAAMIESVDHAVGRILASLDELGISDNTIVFFTSDNGGLLSKTSNSPLRQGKGHPYEGGIRVPAIIRWPGVVQAASLCDEPVTSVDYFPTICEAANVNLRSNNVIDGESLLPLLKQTGSLTRDAIYWHFPHYRGSIVPYSIIRKGDYKLIKHYEDSSFELFNLKDDISENNDLAGTMPEKVTELSAKLDEYLADTQAKLPKPPPA